MKVRVYGQVFMIVAWGLYPAPLMAGEQKFEKPIESEKSNTSGNAKSRIYTHPVRGFTVAVPPGAQLLERDEKNPQISIRSRKGYRVSIQSGPARPKIGLQDMVLKLEAKYLGKGKPWGYKEDQAFKKISGLPAIEASYNGVHTKARVDIIRGRRTDHVFIFFAAEREYQRLEHEYEWMLAHFRPGPDDILKPVVTLASNSLVFAEPEYGYSIRYPKQWVYIKPSRMTAMFSGAEGSDAYSAIVSVQNISPPNAKTSEDAAIEALSELKSSLQKSVQQLQILNDRPWEYFREPYRLNGRELIVSYRHAGQDFMKRILVVPRPFHNLAHIWSYTAPTEIFNTYAETANKMLLSWTILATNKG